MTAIHSSPPRPNLVLASTNQGKLDELITLIADLPFHVVCQTDLGVSAVEETGLTFIENALMKARHVCALTGIAALADDSGLIVDALHGAPGLYSARYAGPKRDDDANNEQLLKNLAEIPPARRTARLYSVVVFLRHALDPQPLIAEASWEGVIALQPRGRRGFGYNPIFIDPKQGCTVAEMDAGLRATLSHRARAFAQIRERLRALAEQQTSACT